MSGGGMNRLPCHLKRSLLVKQTRKGADERAAQCASSRGGSRHTHAAPQVCGESSPPGSKECWRGPVDWCQASTVPIFSHASSSEPPQTPAKPCSFDEPGPSQSDSTVLIPVNIFVHFSFVFLSFGAFCLLPRGGVVWKGAGAER